MRLMRFAFLLLVVPWVGACAYDDAFEPEPLPPEVVYRRPSALLMPPRPPVPAQPRALPPRSTGAWYPQGQRINPRWRAVVIHHSATDKGGAKSFDRTHREDRGWDELGYHFVIGNGTETPDGFIEVGSRWHKQKTGAHCKTADNWFNEHGVGICLVGDFTATRPTSRQMASLRSLVSFLMRECRIPPSRVYSHGEISHSTACPGHHFPMYSFRGSLMTPVAATNLP